MSGLATVRCVQALAAAKRAGLLPIRVDELHAIAYLSEALSPVWDLGAGRDVLKRSSLPFLPDLQRALDHLVMIGLVVVDYFNVEDEHPASSATCHLDHDRSAEMLWRARSFAEERSYEDFLLEIALGFARAADITSIFLEDASYSDPVTSVHRLVELSSGGMNLSSVVAESFDEAIGAKLSSAQRVGLYMNLLANRAQVD